MHTLFSGGKLLSGRAQVAATGEADIALQENPLMVEN